MAPPPRNRGSREAAAGPSIVQRLVKVSPAGIEPLNQFKVPFSLPFLQLLFSCDRVPDIAVMLVRDERLDAVLRSGLRADPIAMLQRARFPRWFVTLT
jgi:hypothetical protein